MLLILGSTGPLVGRVHQLLLEAGEAIDQGELRQAFYGPSTRNAVLDFQGSHVDAGGGALQQDGRVGTVTLAALERPRAPVDVFRAVGWSPAVIASEPEATVCRAAVAEIGVTEYPPGSNRGPRVDAFTGPDWLGAPWCLLFASWCWAQAHGGSPFGVKASALKLRDWGAQHGTLLAGSTRARPGDVALILRAGGRGHGELVVSDEQPGSPLSLVGGNVGNAVRGTVRMRDSLTAVVRPRL